MPVIDKALTLKSIMERQLSFIDEFNKAYEELRNALQNKKWTELQNILKSCTRMSDDVAVLEEKRNVACQELYKELKLPLDRNFLEVASLCPEDFKEQLKTTYFILRTEVYRMKCRLRSLETYSRVRLHLVEEVMSKAQVIQSSGNPYMRAGRRAMHDPDSFLFDAIK